MRTQQSKKQFGLNHSPETSFTLPFPAGGPSITDHDRSLFERFSTVGQMSGVMDYIVKYGHKTKVPSLGVLGETFRAEGTIDTYDIAVTPIGASRDVLLGFFDLNNLDYRPRMLETGDVVDLFGKAARVGNTAIGYLALARNTVKAAGLGYMKYEGVATIFDDTPSPELLFHLVQDLVPGAAGFPMARVDMCTTLEQ